MEMEPPDEEWGPNDTDSSSTGASNTLTPKTAYSKGYEQEFHQISEKVRLDEDRNDERNLGRGLERSDS